MIDFVAEEITQPDGALQRDALFTHSDNDTKQEGDPIAKHLEKNPLVNQKKKVDVKKVRKGLTDDPDYKGESFDGLYFTTSPSEEGANDIAAWE